MAEWVNALANKPDDLCSIHRVHMVEEENQLSDKWSSGLHTRALAHFLQVNE